MQGNATVEGETMRTMTGLPDRFPDNAKYVLEARGPFVRRYIEFPDGQIIELEPRRALTCRCLALRALTSAPKKPARTAA